MARLTAFQRKADTDGFDQAGDDARVVQGLARGLDRAARVPARRNLAQQQRARGAHRPCQSDDLAADTDADRARLSLLLAAAWPLSARRRRGRALPLAARRHATSHRRAAAAAGNRRFRARSGLARHARPARDAYDRDRAASAYARRPLRSRLTAADRNDLDGARLSLRPCRAEEREKLLKRLRLQHRPARNGAASAPASTRRSSRLPSAASASRSATGVPTCLRSARRCVTPEGIVLAINCGGMPSEVSAERLEHEIGPRIAQAAAPDFGGAGISCVISPNPAAPKPSVTHGMVCSSHPAASLAGLDMLRSGGNAIDAAIAAIAVQGVVEPHMTGIGGDCFALFAPKGGAPVALDGSGRAPRAATPAGTPSAASTPFPAESPHAVTDPRRDRRLVHAQPRSWPKAACRSAGAGHPARRRRHVRHAARRLGLGTADREAVARCRDTRASSCPTAARPRTGDTFRNPGARRHLAQDRAKGAEAFYQDGVAAALTQKLKALGGLHEAEDFAQRAQRLCHADQRALSRLHVVYECPPAGQGLAALMILRTIEGLDARRCQAYRGRPHPFAWRKPPRRPIAPATPISATRRTGRRQRSEFLSDAWAAADPRTHRAGPRQRAGLWDDAEHKDTVLSRWSIAISTRSR